MSKILRVNMENRTAEFQEVPDQYALMGGRWLTTSIVCDEVEPTCHPLGPKNKIVVAPGIVTGTAAPTSARISVGGKAPLTGTIKEANAGSIFPYRMAQMGLKAIIIEGQPEDPEQFWLLEVSKDGATFQPADEYCGQMLSESFQALYERYGDKTPIMGIGTSGEMRMSMAGICFNDQDGRATRYAGRGGLGAVLGSKGLKFIVLDYSDAPGVEIADKELFDTGRRKLRDALREHPVTKPGGALNSYGTAVLINILNEAGGLPTRNFSRGTFEGAAKIAGEAINAACQERGGAGMTGHGCSPTCIIQCSNVWPDEDGNEVVSCIEYESDWALGANCEIDDLDAIAKMVKLCNEYGLDTIEAGVTIGVAMEAGLAEFGDAKKAIKLLKKIGKGKGIGRILGQGAAFTGRAYGLTRVPTVKGQAMPAYEPRAVKGIGVTYATSTMGADHTSGYTIAPEILAVGGDLDALEIQGKAETSRNLQVATAFLDATGHCLFIAFAILDIAEGFQGMIEECNGVLGTNWTADDVTAIGKEILKKERGFNEAAGFGPMDDRIPEFMHLEKLPPHNVTWDVPDEMLDSVYDF
ncbi:MAG: aldehyde ferredoxin oxidoreductase [Chloroflexia bacterium]|nr:aldehyde ferredoxin oxidoreductase [Chloroflexia bacterium]